MLGRIRVVLVAMWLASILVACGNPDPVILVATVTPAPATPIPSPTPVPSPTPTPYKDTIVIGVWQEPRTLHPFLDDSPDAIHIQDAIYERYVTSIDFAYQANPSGGLLADVPTLENGGAVLDDGGTPEDPFDDRLTIVYKMLPGPAWCDGQPVTARDSVYAFNLAGDPDSGVASRIALDRVESYTAVDDYTVEVRFKPGQLDQNYASYFWTPLPEHLWGKYSALELQTAAEAARRPCGYGPYTVMGAEDQGAAWIAGDSLTLVANPHYFRGAPVTPRLVFKFFPRQDRLFTEALNGELDVITSDGVQTSRVFEYAGYEARDLIKVVSIHSQVWEQLIFNFNAPTDFDSNSRAQPHPILSDLRVRQAIAHAIDRKALVDLVYAGRSIVLNEALVYPNHPLYTPEDQIALYPFDPTLAGRLLDEAGWIDTDQDGVRECSGCTSGAADGDRLTLTYRTTSSALRDKAVEQVKNDLDAVGFDIVVELLPADVFFGDITGLIVGDVELGQYVGVTAANPGGEREYGCEWIPAPENGWYGENYAGWCNETASQALYDADRALRFDDRRAAYAVFQREYTHDLPGLPLFPRLDMFIVSPDLENFKPSDYMSSVTWNAFELRVRAR